MYNLTELSDYEFLWRTDREAGFMYSILCYMWKEKVYFSKDDIETTLHLVSNDLHMAELWGQFQKSNYPEIFQTASGKSVSLLSWSHYAVLLQVKDKEARDWYEKEAAEQTWSVRTLQRNILSQYYYRMLKTQKAMFYLQQQETE